MDRGIDIRAKTPAGLFYACQTLRQLLPVEIDSDQVAEGVEWSVSRVLIEDTPRCGWRGMHLIAIAAASAAHRQSNSYGLTDSMDHVDFRNPIKVGELVVLKSSVNRAFRTSMEVGVKVFAENVLTGERKHTSSAYVTFVALDEQGNPKEVPPLICETPTERRRWEEAVVRRKWRLSHRYKKIAE